MAIKENILKMSVWKGAIYAILLQVIFGTVVEEIFVHTVFHVIDRMIVRMNKDQQADLADINDADGEEQIEFCQKYQGIQQEKAFLEKQKSVSSFDFNMIKDDERQIQFAIDHHQFNLAACIKNIKEKTA